MAAVSLVGLLSLGSKAVAGYGLHVAGTDWPIWFGLPAKLDVFAFGIVLAAFVARSTNRSCSRSLGSA